MLPWQIELAKAMAVYCAMFVGGGVLVRLVHAVPALRGNWVCQFWCCDPPPAERAAAAHAPSPGNPTVKLLLAAVGIYGTLISQGVFQEQLMTQRYTTGPFTSSGFAIMCTRVLACAAAHVGMVCMPDKKDCGRHVAFYKFSYSALCNIVSSWCQYESLKHTSFPITTLAKSAKTIPVMAMGRLLHGRVNSWSDYGTALVVVAGVCGFALTTGESQSSAATSPSGVALLSLYLSFDSFQSQWQGGLFKTSNVGQLEMMRGVNFWGALLSAVSLWKNGELWAATQFVLANTSCMGHLGMLAVMGTLGQLCIYYTISNFGPVIFSMLMASRQIFSLAVSSALFGHELSPTSLPFAALVFVSFFAKIRNVAGTLQRERKLHKE